MEARQEVFQTICEDALRVSRARLGVASALELVVPVELVQEPVHDRRED